MVISRCAVIPYFDLVKFDDVGQFMYIYNRSHENYVVHMVLLQYTIKVNILDSLRRISLLPNEHCRLAMHSKGRKQQTYLKHVISSRDSMGEGWCRQGMAWVRDGLGKAWCGQGMVWTRHSIRDSVRDGVRDGVDKA